MSGKLSIGAVLVAQQACNTDSPFPSGIDTIPFDVNPAGPLPDGGLPFNVKTGDMQANVTGSGYVALGGIGPSGPVTQANFLMLNVQSAFNVRITSGGVPFVIPGLSGPLTLQLAEGSEVTLVEVSGSGAVEYFASGAA